MVKKIYWFLFEYDLNGSLSPQRSKKPESFKSKLINDLACMVLFSYTLFIFSPLVPIFADIIAHTFWEKEHLMAEHKLMGKNHIYLQLLKSAKQSEKDKSSSNPKTGSEEYISVTLATNTFVLKRHFIILSYPAFLFYSPIAYPDVHCPPPWGFYSSLS